MHARACSSCADRVQGPSCQQGLLHACMASRVRPSGCTPRSSPVASQCKANVSANPQRAAGPSCCSQRLHECEIWVVILRQRQQHGGMCLRHHEPRQDCVLPCTLPNTPPCRPGVARPGLHSTAAELSMPPCTHAVHALNLIEPAAAHKQHSQDCEHLHNHQRRRCAPHPVSARST
jgi:hypothetical protein